VPNSLGIEEWTKLSGSFGGLFRPTISEKDISITLINMIHIRYVRD